MNIAEALTGVESIFLDSAPVIYYLEEDARYLARVDWLFDTIDAQLIRAVASPVTLAECLIIPMRLEQANLQQAFIDLLTASETMLASVVDNQIAILAADLRARYNLPLLDAFQLARAIHTDCEVFLTNDVRLKRVTELRILTLDELDAT